MDLLQKAYARATFARQIPIYPKHKPKIEPPNPTAAALVDIARMSEPRVWSHRLPGVAPWREEIRGRPAVAPPLPRVVLIKEIIKAVAAEFGVTVEQIRGNYRTRKYVFPRHVAQYLACRICKLSLPIVGRHFYRDHTSVLSGRKKIERLIGEDPVVAALVERLEAQLRA
jgi:hypothetical protein